MKETDTAASEDMNSVRALHGDCLDLIPQLSRGLARAMIMALASFAARFSYLVPAAGMARAPETRRRRYIMGESRSIGAGMQRMVISGGFTERTCPRCGAAAAWCTRVGEGIGTAEGGALQLTPNGTVWQLAKQAGLL